MKASLEKQSYVMQGENFGARGCSGCTCDPCDCNPCNCGDGVAIPRWRVSGYFVEKGELEALDVSGLLILSLAQPCGESEAGAWQEVLLIDSRASISQAAALLNAFEARLASIPAEIGTHFSGQRSVYQVPMSYHRDEQRSWLEVEFMPEQALPLRESAESLFKEWRYSGPMALR
ncbi:hypothetical protein KSC_094400 [Ktedonobacter sp. SOSP1-52]|uniref:DUF1326 domain-containing protein n=1 Tax=Ktedonobacter sp. SOSP1-52 TaxID=2778366 RepID=UPI0019166051|nr:DUF1326 domain-containing protein [Ktedonobacter sp. SOSP1-52]GHO70548.1 hypothetical protein KSC_094400 [Ktedonobacter sp. SOSP1-52]